MSLGHPPTRGLLDVASLSAQSARRSRLTVATLVLVLAAPPILALQATGDGSAAGRVRALLSWGMDFDTLVLSLTTVFLSTSLADDLRSGRLIQLCAAPLRREALLVGWWLGVVSVLAALALSAVASLGVTALALEALTPERDRPSVSNSLRAQGVAHADRPDEGILRERVDRELSRLAATGRLPKDLTLDEASERVERNLRTRLRTVPRQQTVAWSVRGIAPGPNAEGIALRFRYQARSTQPIGLEDFPAVRGVFAFEAPGSQDALTVRGTWTAGTWHQVPLPLEVLAGGDTLTISYQNADERPVVVVFPEAGVDVLYPAGGFFANLGRTAIVLLGRLAFLAAVGLAFASMINGRLAAGVVLWFLVLGASAAFLRESLGPGVLGAADSLLRPLLDGFLWAIPDLGRVDLADALASGKRVQWVEVARSLGGDALARGGLILGVGSLLFAQRELGALR